MTPGFLAIFALKVAVAVAVAKASWQSQSRLRAIEVAAFSPTHLTAKCPCHLSSACPCHGLFTRAELGRRRNSYVELTLIILPVFHMVTDHVDLQIAFSRDGLVWTRPERRAILSVGPRGSGEEGQLYPCAPPVELPDGDWAVQYLCRSTTHTVAEEYKQALFPEYRPDDKRWARWRPHRLCGVEAENEGRFTIPTVFRRENELRLNYRCAPGGFLSVELLQAIPSKNCPDVDPLEGFTFTACDRLMGDEVDQVVTWQGNSDISGVGEMVAIRVKMFGAKLFAYKV